jgi:glycosyltransferase involved in cell wall biosynthesis
MQLGQNYMLEQDRRNSNSYDQDIHTGGYSYLFTVFTPTYNRAHSLHRVYESLQAQTFRDFEWLIVDDGSKDNTQEIVENWQQTAEFPIRYIYQQNAGKNSASNLGVSLAQGELFLNLDSDDRCMSNALERFYHHWDNIPTDQKHLFSAVTALCEDQHGNLQGKEVPQAVMDANPLEMLYRYGLRKEMWGFQRTDVMKEFPFAVMSGQHIDEGIVWSKIAGKYQTRFINEVLRVYYYVEDVGKDRLTQQDPSKKSLGMIESRKYVLSNETSWFRYAPLSFLRDATHYNRFGFHIQNSLAQPPIWKIGKQIGDIDCGFGKILVAVMMPLGCLVYLRDRQRISKSTN